MLEVLTYYCDNKIIYHWIDSLTNNAIVCGVHFGCQLDWVYDKPRHATRQVEGHLLEGLSNRESSIEVDNRGSARRFQKIAFCLLAFARCWWVYRFYCCCHFSLTSELSLLDFYTDWRPVALQESSRPSVPSWVSWGIYSCRLNSYKALILSSM